MRSLAVLGMTFRWNFIPPISFRERAVEESRSHNSFCRPRNEISRCARDDIQKETLYPHAFPGGEMDGALRIDALDRRANAPAEKVSKKNKLWMDVH